MRDERIALITQNALLHFDQIRYRLSAWVIMPNHIHFLLKPQFPLTQIIHSLKSYTALRANRLLNLHGKFWQEDYFDRYIRDAEHFAKVVRYIERNPVKAGLCETPEDWRFGSAGFKNKRQE